jgi:hypothetical protein
LLLQSANVTTRFQDGTRRRIVMRKFAIVSVAALATIGLALSAGKASARSEKESGSFSSTGVDDNASGAVKLVVKNGSDGKLEIKGKRLDPDATYDVLVDGVLVGRFTTSGGGNGRLRFRSRPHSNDALLGFDPRGALLVVRNAAGQDVLAVQLADSGSVDPGEIICCIPDDSGPECEDRTADACTAAGGTATTATSCLPNPCAGTPPPTEGDVVCCIPDDSGPECEDRSADDCALAGGVAVEATSCDPNPCAPVTPPANDDVQCCLPDDSGPSCEDRTPSQCAVEGGVSAGVGACTPDACGAVPPPSANATVLVKCEVRSNRSKISVDGNGLATGSYQAVATSGANSATAAAHQTVGDEVSFDFDSDAGDIAAGATAIASDFIQGTPPQVTGAIVTLSGGVVAQATVDCVVK